MIDKTSEAYEQGYENGSDEMRGKIIDAIKVKQDYYKHCTGFDKDTRNMLAALCGDIIKKCEESK